MLPSAHTLALTLALCCASQGVRGQDSCDLPLVVEHYDRICILHAVSPRSGYVTTRVWFERNGTIYGEHNLCDAYRSVGGPHFCLAWTEWDTCYRRVYAPQAVETWVEGEIDDGLWWAMGRQMRPLAAPGAAP